MERSPRTSNIEDTAYDFTKGELEFGGAEPEVMTTPPKTENLAPGMETGIEHAPETPASPTAELLRSATERLAGFLDNRALTKEDRLAARAERIEGVKNTLRAYGSAALNTAFEVSVTTASVTYLAVESGLDTVNTVREKAVAFGIAAKERLHKRRSYREAYAMNTAYDQRVAYEKDHEEALAMNEQKKADQEAAFDSYAPNIEFTEKREAQDEAFETYEDNVSYSEMLETARELNARAEAARARKEARKEARREKFGHLRDKGSELALIAKKGFKVYGRALLRGLKRTGRAVKAGATAARESWKQA